MAKPEQLDSRLVQPSLKIELLVIALLAMGLLGLDGVLRTLEGRLSGNIAHIKDIPMLSAQAGENGPYAAFLGNSLTNNAIDPNQIETHLQQQKPDSLHFTKIVPDGTALSDWYCIYSNHIEKENPPPTLIVIGFAWAQLSDQYPINAARLGGYFCQSSDLFELSHTALSEHDNLLTFFVGSMSRLYLNREAIRNRILTELVPNYQAVAQEINRPPVTADEDSPNNEPSNTTYSYATLTSLARKMRANGTHLTILAMPVQEHYELDPAMVDTARREGIRLVDLRSVPGLDNDHFKDSIHLNSQGRKVFSTVLAGILAEQGDSHPK